MGYFYGKNSTVTYSKCDSYDNIISNGGSVIENDDGTISVYTLNGPLFLDNFCCTSLKDGYYFDANSQTCRWSSIGKVCSLDSFKLTLNPIGNDGNIFYVDENLNNTEKCSLNIEFDYIFKVSCESLTNILVKKDLVTTNANGCLTPIDVLENLDVSVLLEYVDSTNKLITVATYPLFTPIGTGKLYDYLTTTTDSGFLVCGEPNPKEKSKGITGCTPIYLESNSTKNVSTCDGLITNILDGLFNQSKLDKAMFDSSYDKNWLSSNWLHYQTIVSGDTILSEIVNKKIKLTIQVNNSCGEFCILLDNIKLNKDCSLVTENNIFISTPPSFNLTRVIDNKKSWVANTTPENRPFQISNVLGVNNIRQTNYNVNDERLVINTKEIDLDMNIASAIETDVFCYINDNLNLLDSVPKSGCDCSDEVPCYKDVFKIITHAEAVALSPCILTDAEHLLTKIRASRDAWTKAWNEVILATPAYLDIKDSIYTPIVSPYVMDTYNSGIDAYLKAAKEFNLASMGGVGIEGLVDKPDLNNYKESFVSQIVNTKCGRIFKLCAGYNICDNPYYVYLVETPEKELKIYMVDTDAAPSTTWIDISNLVEDDYHPDWTPSIGGYYNEKKEFYCQTLSRDVNLYGRINTSAFHYQTNNNTNVNQWIRPPEDNFYIGWDSTKNKCMTNMVKQNVPEDFSMEFPITDITWAKVLYPYDTNDEQQCYLDIINRNSGSTACGVIDWTWPHIANNITEIRRDYRDYIYKQYGQNLLNYNNTYYSITVKDPLTNTTPDESSGNIPVKVTTTISKNNPNGQIVFKEEYVLNDTLGYIPSDDGLVRLVVPIGITDPYSFYKNPSGDTTSLYSLCNTGSSFSCGTHIYGSTSTMPFPGASSDGINRDWEFHDDINYYVHFDVVNNITNEVYYVTNNDFNLKDRPLPIKCPSSASTQTLDINNALESIQVYKQTVMGQIQEDLDWALNNCTNC